MPEDEVSRIRRVYEDYANDTRTRRRWSPTDPGNVQIEQERDAAIRSLLSARGFWPPSDYRILDLGCGTGRLLRRFIGWGTRPANAVGIDLLADRFTEVRRAPVGPLLALADGAKLPFANGAFRLTIVFTVFSSILDDEVATIVAAEMDRVIEPGGGVLWYDFRVGSPWNPNTRGIPRRRILRLFPGYRADLRRLTLVPQVARRLGPLVRRAYPILASLPFARTHYAGLLIKE